MLLFQIQTITKTIGEYFHGNLPIISQIMLILFKIQARWVAWSTEHHINHYAFASDEEGEAAEEMEEQSRANMPLFLLKNYAWSDLMAMMFGYSHELSVEKQPSFLVIDEEAKKQRLVKLMQQKTNFHSRGKKSKYESVRIYYLIGRSCRSSLHATIHRVQRM